ncbi:hypothetical protein K443DRAFT_3489 [Laccaria amethystina LaAM-08-1]|uniref:Uncharacterized protein n=1 Tax=Laccaria amethystina LaAM-08-1 TaxID=1095629 RepID=A0A0C9Y6V7_9AGAR|nr:hypothetical protein K443DRAFT_3489 [Laccaria amethystina LaAM-08-1]
MLEVKANYGYSVHCRNLANGFLCTKTPSIATAAVPVDIPEFIIQILSLAILKNPSNQRLPFISAKTQAYPQPHEYIALATKFK